MYNELQFYANLLNLLVKKYPYTRSKLYTNQSLNITSLSKLSFYLFI